MALQKIQSISLKISSCGFMRPSPTCRWPPWCAPCCSAWSTCTWSPPPSPPSRHPTRLVWCRSQGWGKGKISLDGIRPWDEIFATSHSHSSDCVGSDVHFVTLHQPWNRRGQRWRPCFKLNLVAVERYTIAYDGWIVLPCPPFSFTSFKKITTVSHTLPHCDLSTVQSDFAKRWRRKSIYSMFTFCRGRLELFSLMEYPPWYN